MGFKEKKYFQDKNIARSNDLILLTQKSILEFQNTYPDFKGNIECIENPISKQIDRNIVKDHEIENINIYFFMLYFLFENRMHQRWMLTLK
jgi:hypothetical protein